MRFLPHKVLISQSSNLTKFLPHKVLTSQSSYLTKFLPHKVLTSQSSYLTKFLPYKVLTSQSYYLTKFLSHKVLASQTSNFTKFLSHKMLSWNFKRKTLMGQLNKMAEIALVCKTNYSMYVWILFTFSKWLIFEKHTSYITKLLPLKVLSSRSSNLTEFYLTKFLHIKVLT